MAELESCPICKNKVDWCRCSSEGCHQIACKKCGNFDLANGDDKHCETLEELREHCAKKFNFRA